MNPADEAAFEEHIASWLVERGGYRRVKVGNAGGEPRDFDPGTGVDTADLFEFIGATQADEWERLVDSAYGGDPNQAQSGFVQRLASELDKRGTVDVLRRGVVDRNVKIQLAYFKPAQGLTPELMQRYEANVLSVTRQLPFERDGGRTVDLGLFVNGIPVATAELKNPLTGQTVENAIAQYRADRPHNNTTLGRLGMVHCRGRHRIGGNDHPTCRCPHTLSAVQPGAQPRRGESSESRWAPNCLSVGAGVVARCLDGHSGPLHSCGEALPRFQSSPGGDLS